MGIYESHNIAYCFHGRVDNRLISILFLVGGLALSYYGTIHIHILKGLIKLIDQSYSNLYHHISLAYATFQPQYLFP